MTAAVVAFKVVIPARLGSTRLPRATPTFDEICGDTEAEAGSKRVAVVLGQQIRDEHHAAAPGHGQRGPCRGRRRHPRDDAGADGGQLSPRGAQAARGDAGWLRWAAEVAGEKH